MNERASPTAYFRDLTPEEVGRFHRDGYVLVKGGAFQALHILERAHEWEWSGGRRGSPCAYDVTEVARACFGTEEVPKGGATQYDLSALRAAVRADGRPRLIDNSGSSAIGHFYVDTNLASRNPHVAEITHKRGPFAQIAELLGVPQLRYYDDQYFVKEPWAADRVAFHQDASYFHIDGTEGVTAWIPLDDVPLKAGALGYVPGSHRSGAVFDPNIFMSRMPFPGGTGNELPDIEATENEFGVVYVPMERGDFLLHHFRTIHGSRGNTTAVPRRAFSLRFCDAQVRYRRRPGAQDRPGVPIQRDGELLSDLHHPCIYDWNGEPSLEKGCTVTFDREGRDQGQVKVRLCSTRPS